MQQAKKAAQRSVQPGERGDCWAASLEVLRLPTNRHRFNDASRVGVPASRLPWCRVQKRRKGNRHMLGLVGRAWHVLTCTRRGPTLLPAAC